jgi:hypothetical protein
MHGRVWTGRAVSRFNKEEYLIDEQMSFQGSCWFMHRSYFKKLGLMDEVGWGPFWQEAQEIGLHAWLSGGKVMVNKNTWYAHLHKGKKHGRGYHLPEDWLQTGRGQSSRFFAGEKVWPDQIHPLSWIVKKFWPAPTWTEELLKGLEEREATYWNKKTAKKPLDQVNQEQRDATEKSVAASKEKDRQASEKAAIKKRQEEERAASENKGT